MTLEQQVCSLERAKQLKELGVSQESLFYWTKPLYSTGGYSLAREVSASGDGYSAFTVAELGEILAPYLGRNIWFLSESEKDGSSAASKMIDEAENRSKMLIHLCERRIYQPFL